VVGWGLALTVPVAFFLATQLALGFLKADLRPRPEGPRRRFLEEAADGYRYLWRRRELFELTVSALAINFFSAVAFVELSLYATFSLGVSNAILLGALISGGSLGAAVGTLAINRFRFERRAGRFLAVLTVCQGLTVVALGFTHSIWFALPTMFLFGLFPGMFMTVFLATIQATVPNATLGRVLAADEVGSYGLVPVGQWAGGLLTASAGVSVAYISAGIGTAAIGGLMASVRNLRALGFDPQAPSEPVAASDAPAVPMPDPTSS
jgi:sugar phosphate permease